MVWTVPSPWPLRGQVAPTQSLHLPHAGAWLGVASEGFADFESIHARRFRRGVQRAHRQVPLESGVLPVTPRGIVAIWRAAKTRIILPGTEGGVN